MWKVNAYGKDTNGATCDIFYPGDRMKMYVDVVDGDKNGHYYGMASNGYGRLTLQKDMNFKDKADLLYSSKYSPCFVVTIRHQSRIIMTVYRKKDKNFVDGVGHGTFYFLTPTGNHVILTTNGGKTFKVHSKDKTFDIKEKKYVVKTEEKREITKDMNESYEKTEVVPTE